VEEIDDWDELEEKEQAEETAAAVPAVGAAEVRAELCRKMAQRLLRDQRIAEPPVPVDRIAKTLGFAVQHQDLPRGIHARLQIIDSRRVIELARGEADARHRFSIAHELGHFFLGHRHNEHKTGETEANLFAGELLIPRTWLRRDLANHLTVAELIARYRVSREVLFIVAKDARLLNRLR